MEAELVRRHRAGNLHAREELVKRLTPVVERLARRYRGHEQPEDLRQAGFLGLAKAIDRYDPALGVPLRSYAIPTVLGELRRYKRDLCWAVRPPRGLQELTLRVTTCVDQLTSELGRQPRVEQVSAALGEDEEDVVEALIAGQAYRASSLDAPLVQHDSDTATLGETLSAGDAGYQRIDQALFVGALQEMLGEQERLLLDLRFRAGWTQQEIGEHLGISQMTVSRRQRTILERLRAHLEDDAWAGAAQH